MYCSNCGTKIPDDSVFCPSCGTRVQVGPAKAVDFQSATPTAAPTTPTPYIQEPSPTGMSIPVRPTEVTIAAIVDFIVGGLMLLGFLMLLLTLPFFMSGMTGSGFEMNGDLGSGYSEQQVMAVLSGLFIFIAILFLVGGILTTLAGYGLLKLRNWGKILHVIVWVLGLLNFPVGTIISALLIWAVFTKNAKEAFQQAAQNPL